MSVVPQEAPDLMTDPGFITDPYPIYRVWRDNFPVTWHEGIDAYILSRYDDVDRAFREFSSENYAWQLEPIIGRSILQLEGTAHARQRAIVAPAFRGKELDEKFVPVIRRNAEELVDAFRNDGHVDLVKQFTKLLPIHVIVDMLGLPREDHEKFNRWYTIIMDFLSNVSGDEEINREGMQTANELREYLKPLIAHRRTDPGDDILSKLCTAEIEGERMSDADINAFTGLLLNAGGETSDKAIASMFKNLMLNPDQLDAVREDRSLIVRAFAETLRYTPPVRIIMRTVREDTELSGTVLEAGKTVACVIGAANTDERHFSDPDSFDIFREDLDVSRAFSGAANHVAFCAGRHFCVGAMLARTEIEIGTNLLLDAMDDMHFPEGYTPVDEGLFTRSPGELLIDFVPASG